MNIQDIWDEIFELECDLIGGRIAFGYDKQMCAMKPGHPGEILESIIIDVGGKLFQNKENEITLEELEVMSERLKLFMGAFQVQELNAPIEKLDAYIANRQAETIR